MSHQTLNPSAAVVESVTFLASANPPRWTGRVRLPGKDAPIDILIFRIQGELLAFPAFCPHEGYDLRQCPLHAEQPFICPAHSKRIKEFRTLGYGVEERNGQFLIFSSNNAVTEEQLLRDEIEKLRLATRKQERQIHVITRSLDAMLYESEQQKFKFKEYAEQQSALNRFVDRIMDTLDDLIFVIDKKGRIRRINTAVERELKFAEAELLGTSIDDLLPSPDRQQLALHLPILPWPIQSVLLETIRLKGHYAAELTLLGKHPENSNAVYWLKSSLLHSEQGKQEGAVVSALNITELKQREIQLRLNAKAFENTSEAIFITDPKGTFLDVNAAFCAITGYERSEVLGRNTRLLKSNLHDREFYENMWRSLTSRGYWKGEIWDRCKSGEFCPMLLSINAVTDEQGNLTHYVAISTNITQQKETEQALKQLAYFDVLTNLPNRSLFKDRLEQEILQAQRQNKRLAVLFLDLDHFKDVNDTLGHWAGDSLLQVVATRIQGCLRKSDTVARLGGDEFTIILPGLIGISDATEIASQLIDTLAEPVYIKEHGVYAGVSIGIAIYPDDGNDFDVLTKHADTAMYVSKMKGRGRFQYFEDGMNEAAHQRLLLEYALRKALENEEFQLYYQPKADCASGRITGAEALIRWRRPGLGMVPPDRFITIAEETGLIIPLGAWILKTACQQASVWSKRQPGFRIAINLSPRQLLADGFITELDHILAETTVGHDAIELEVTESLVMHDIGKAIERLHQIHARGIRIAMDDFGTGYSSLSYLQKLPIQSLKIDRSFIMAYAGDPESREAEFIKTIISLGHVLKLTVIAEGVENETQLALLQSYQCCEIQGYFISPPVPADEFQKRWF